MSEWPNADWLTDAIDRWTDTVETSDNAWESIQERVRLGPENPDNDALGDSISRERPGFRRLFAIAAVLVALTGVVFVGRQGNSAIETGPAANDGSLPPTNTSATEPPPPRLVEVPCRRLSADPTSYLVELASGETSTVVISSAAVGADNQTITMFHLAQESAADQSRQTRLSEELRREDSLAFIDVTSFGEEQLDSVFAALAPSFCHSPAFYLILGQRLETGLFCETGSAPGTGFAGLIALDPAQPPPSCSGVHPTILIGSVSVEDPQVQDWVTAYGCENPEKPEVDDSSFRWTGCAATFVYAQTNTPNPWDSTVGGLSLQDFVQSIKTLAR